MAKNGKTHPAKPDDWRGLLNGPNKGKSKAVSWRAKMRIFFARAKFAALAAAACAAAYGCYHLYSTSFFDDLFGLESSNIKRIEFKTDGVITPKWIGSYIKLNKKAKLADVNIFAVKSALENLTQIKTAAVERVYPDKLRITITERRPMAKASAEIDMRTVLYLISPEGAFYEPICVNAEYIESLPAIVGCDMNFNGRTPKNLECAHKVEEFLAYTQAKMPLHQWASINVKDIDSVVPLISAKTREGVKVIFSPKDYPKQFDRLEYVLKYSKQNNIQDIKQIDLSLKERADVKLRTPQK